MKRLENLQIVKPPCKRENCLMFGQIHTRCKAHNRSGQPCMLHPRIGQAVCGFHGGASPNALKKGAERAAMAKVMSRAGKLVAFNEDDQETPAEGLLREVLWSGQVAKALGEACEQFIGDDQLTHKSPTGDRINALMQAWKEERELHARLCKMALDAGIEQRQLDIIETQAGQIISAMLALLSSPRLALTSEQIVEGRIVAAEVLLAHSNKQVV